MGFPVLDPALGYRDEEELGLLVYMQHWQPFESHHTPKRWIETILTTRTSTNTHGKDIEAAKQSVNAEAQHEGASRRKIKTQQPIGPLAWHFAPAKL